MRRVKLADAFILQMGKTPSRDEPQYWDGDFAWVAISDMGKGKYICKTKETISQKGIKESGIKIVPKNTVVMSFKLSIGKTAITSDDMYTNEAIMALIDKKIYNINVDYLYHALSSVDWDKNGNRAVMGVTLNKATLSNIEIPLPEIEEQCHVATGLDKLDSIIETRKNQLSKLDQLVKSRFIEMFGDPVDNPYKWETKRLGSLGELNRGVSKHRPRNAPELLNGKYPLIQTGDVSSADLYLTKYFSTYSELGLQQSRMWPSGTLCITIAANIAKTAILKFDACFPDSVVGFLSGMDTNQIFIHFWFSFFQKILEEQAPESAQKNINLKILNELSVIVPPLPLQEEFAAFVQKVDKAKSAVKQSLEKLETLKKSLMQEYFG